MARTKARPAAGHPNDAKWDSVIADLHRLADTYQAGGMAAVEKAFRVTRLPNPGLHPTMDEHLDQLRVAAYRRDMATDQSNGKFQSQLIAARADSQKVNSVIQLVGQHGLAEGGLLLLGPDLPGPLWYDNEADRGGWARAAIRVPDGVGVAVYEHDQNDESVPEHLHTFRPFAECDEKLQAALSPHIEGLVAQLVARVFPPPAEPFD